MKILHAKEETFVEAIERLIAPEADKKDVIDALHTMTRMLAMDFDASHLFIHVYGSILTAEPPEPLDRIVQLCKGAHELFQSHYGTPLSRECGAMMLALTASISQTIKM